MYSGKNELPKHPNTYAALSNAKWTSQVYASLIGRIIKANGISPFLLTLKALWDKY